MSNIVKQSRKVTLSGTDFTVMQKRFLYEILRRCQSMYSGITVRDVACGRAKIDIKDMIMNEYRIPVDEVMLGTSNNRQYVREGLELLAKKMVCRRNSNGSFFHCNYIDSLSLPAGSNVITARMTASFYEEMADLSWGMTVCDLDVVKNLPSEYSMKMYERIVRMEKQDTPPIPIDELRFFFGTDHFDEKNGALVTRQYKNVSDFLAKTLDKAKKDLDDVKYRSPYTFDYEKVKKGKSIVAVRIHVKVRNEFLPDADRSRYAWERSSDTADEVTENLKRHGWKMDSIKNNSDILREAAAKMDIIAALDELHRKAGEKGLSDNGVIGYVINGIKGMLKDISIPKKS